MTSLEIKFVREDFEDTLEAAGIDPDSVTEYEWRKFTDAFCDGTSWHEVAGYACETIHRLREEEKPI